MDNNNMSGGTGENNGLGGNGENNGLGENKTDYVYNPNTPEGQYAYSNPYADSAQGNYSSTYANDNRNNSGNTNTNDSQNNYSNSYANDNQNNYGNPYANGNTSNQDYYAFQNSNPYDNQGNAYANSGYQGYQPELEEPVKMGDWMLLQCLLTFIPCVGVILAIVWAFSKNEKKSKVNFCKAYLVVFLIQLVLGIVMIAVWGGVLLAAIDMY